MSIKRVQKILFQAFLFFLPFQIGLMYTHLLKADIIYAFDAVLFILYALWIKESNGFARPPVYWGKVTLPTILILIWTCVSFINAISATMTGLGLFMIIKAFMMYLYVVNHIVTKKDLRMAVNWLLGGLLFQGVLGLVQFTTGSSLGLEFAGALVKEKHLSGLTRIRGTLGMPNHFGAWLALLFPLSISLFIFEHKSRQKAFYGFAALFGCFAVLLSFSRSAWAGIIGGTVIFLIIIIFKRLMKPRYFLALGVATIIIAGLVVYFWPLIMRRFEAGSTGKYRMLMIDIAFDIFKENFLYGVGLHNYRFHSIQRFRFWHPVHNTYLRLLAETGLPGLVFFLMLVFVSIRESYKMLRSKVKFIFTVALGTLASLVAFLFTINFGPEYQHYRIKVLFWVIIGVVFSLRRVYHHTMKMRKLQMEQQKQPTPVPSGAKAETPLDSAVVAMKGWNR
ncbi:MAG: O-antigen ligase family protein [bacterium]